MIAFIVLLVLFILLLNWRRIFPWLMLYFVQKLIKKIEKNHSGTTAKSTMAKKRKPKETLGEYIDYEEVD